MNKGAIIRTFILVAAFVLVIAVIVASRRVVEVAPPAAKLSPTGTTTPAKWVVARNPVLHAFLHWNELSYIGPATSPNDPGPGNVIMLENWVETDSSGRQIFQHTIAKLPDGSLYQETFDNAQESVIIRGPGYYGVFGDSNDLFWCVSKSAPQSPQDLNFPYYVDVQQLQSDSFAMILSSSSGKTLPDPPTSLNNIVPTTTLALPTTYQVWTHTGPSSVGNYTDKVRFATDAQGRIVSFDLQKLEQSGQLKSDQWYSIGPIAIYPATVSVPTSVMQEPPQVTQGCKE